MSNQDLVAFLERNSNKQSWEAAHSGLVNDIMNRLSSFGIDYSPSSVYSGVKLIGDSNFSGSVDIAVLTNSGDLVIIEAEIAPFRSRIRAVKSRIVNKLERYSEYFERRFEIAPICYGVYRIKGSNELKRHYFGVVPFSHDNLFLQANP